MVENTAVRNGSPDTEWQFAALSHPVRHLSLFLVSILKTIVFWG